MFSEPAAQPPHYQTTKDVARLLNVSESTVRLWVKLGKLPTIKLPNGTNLFDRRDVLRVLDRLRKEPAPAA